MALNALELVAGFSARSDAGVVDAALVADLLQRRALLYDKAGEEHFNIISALHKSMRNSDPDAAVYWLARMLEAGEDPMYVARRLVRFASEDVGNADPQALVVTVAASQAAHQLGMPEANTALAQAAVYLATAPKSNAVYRAYGSAAADATEDLAEPVPAHLRNAPTRLMKQLGYGKGYRYAHEEPDAVADMSCLPPRLEGRQLLPADPAWLREDPGRATGTVGGDQTGPTRVHVRTVASAVNSQRPDSSSPIRGQFTGARLGLPRSRRVRVFCKFHGANMARLSSCPVTTSCGTSCGLVPACWNAEGSERTAMGRRPVRPRLPGSWSCRKLLILRFHRS